MAGYFFGAVRFDSTRLMSQGYYDLFLAKWDPVRRAFAWAQRGGGQGYDYAYAGAVSGGSVYVAGSVQGTATFGGHALPGNYQDNGYVTKFTDTGRGARFEGAQAITSDYSASGRQLASSGSRVYATGPFVLSAQLGTIALAKQDANTTIFVAKLTDAGSTSAFVGAKQVVCSGEARAYALATASSNVYLAGAAAGDVTFDAIRLRSVGYRESDAFVAKLTDAGSTASFVWAQLAGEPNHDQASGLAVRGSSVYVAGSFLGTVTFGVLPPQSATGSTNNYDVFVTKLTDAGATSSFTWVQSAGGANACVAGLAASKDHVYVGGTFYGRAEFIPHPLVNPNLNETGFLASLMATTPLATARFTPALSPCRYPNPAHGRATVWLPTASHTNPATLTLLNALGQVVRTQLATPATAGTTTELDLSGLVPGVDALRIAMGSAVTTPRLVVE